jgi:hypothetical protein
MDLNTASLEALAKLVGVDRAYDLLLWRPYLDWGEVACVPSLGPDELAALRAGGARVKLPGDPLTWRDHLNHAGLTSATQGGGPATLLLACRRGGVRGRSGADRRM